MVKDGILSKIGIPRGDLLTALRHYSSGEINPVKLSCRWSPLKERLRMSGYSAYEFLFWAQHYMQEPNFLVVLRQANRLSSESVWEQFLKWKEDASRYARVQMEIHRDNAEVAFRFRDIREVLLDSSMTIGPVARIDISLESLPEAASDVLKAYAQKAGEVLVGVPEFLDHAPSLQRYLDSTYEARQFFPF